MFEVMSSVGVRRNEESMHAGFARQLHASYTARLDSTD